MSHFSADDRLSPRVTARRRRRRAGVGLVVVLALGGSAALVAAGHDRAGHRVATSVPPSSAAVATTTPTPTTAPTATTTPASSAPATTAVPAATVVSPGELWVLTATGRAAAVGEEALVAFDPATGAVGRPIPLGAGTHPILVALAPDGATAYLVERTSVTGARIVPLDLRRGTTGRPIAVPASVPDFGPTSVAFSPGGTNAYFADALDGELVPVDLAAGTVGTPVPLGTMAACGDDVSYTAVTPDGRDAYVESLGHLYDVDLAAGTSSPAFSVPASLASGYGDPAIAMSPDGTTLWTLTSGPTADTLVAVQTAGDGAGATIRVPVPDRRVPLSGRGGNAEPAWDDLVVPTDGTALVVAFGSVPEQVIPVDLATGRPGTPVAVGDLPSSTVCGDSPPVPVGITASGTVAVAGVPGRGAVRSVTLATGVRSAPVTVGGDRVLAVLSPTGYRDWALP